MSEFQTALKKLEKFVPTARIAVAEFLGTALLVALGCATCTQGLDKNFQRLSIFNGALGFGLVVAMIVLIIGHISGGHINPAVSIGAAILQVIKPEMLLVYIPSQILGGMTGYGLLLAMTGSAIIDKDQNGSCVSRRNANIDLSDTNVFMAEFLGTATLMLVVCAVFDKRNPNNQTVPLQIGLAITGLVLVIGERSGASMNPARSFGPSVWTDHWTSLHWVYWIGPISGSTVAATFYRFVFGFEHEVEKPKPTKLQELVVESE